MMALGRSVLRFLVLGAISGLVVALGARLWDEVLDQRRREGADWSEQIELDQTVLPGISVRS
jgi:hypothetical protein